MLTNSIGKNIKYLRNKKKITQYELGQAIGVSTQAVSKWERGGTPDISMLPAIADFFNISIDAIFGREEPSKDKLSDYLYNDILNTNSPDNFEKACEYSWNIFKGLSKIQGLHNYNYCNLSPENETTRCRISNDIGIGWAASSNDFHLVCIAPEPKSGFNVALGELSEYARLFKILSDIDYLKFLIFLYKHSQILFSEEYASEKTNIPTEKVREILIAFKNEKWVLEETVYLDNNSCVFYRPVHKEVFIFFMYFAKEMTIHPYLWHLSNVKRKIPYLHSEKEIL